jgi:hypothetical protein
VLCAGPCCAPLVSYERAVRRCRVSLRCTVSTLPYQSDGALPPLSTTRYSLSILSDLAAKQNINDIGDDHIIAWANEKVRLRAAVVASCAL